MKYRYQNTPQGKVVIKHRFTGDDAATLVRKSKSADGHTVYGEMATGMRIRLSPIRPWHGKSERRTVIRNRREDRELAAKNLAQ